MEEVKKAGLSIIVEKLDYLDADDINTIVKKYGNQVEIVSLNAATGEKGPVTEVLMKKIKRVFEVNVFQIIKIAQRSTKIFVAKKKGKIAFTFSIAGFIIFPFFRVLCCF